MAQGDQCGLFVRCDIDDWQPLQGLVNVINEYEGRPGVDSVGHNPTLRSPSSHQQTTSQDTTLAFKIHSQGRKQCGQYEALKAFTIWREPIFYLKSEITIKLKLPASVSATNNSIRYPT